MATGEVKYNPRFGISYIGDLQRVNTRGGPLPPAVSETLRQSGVSGYVKVARDVDIADLMAGMGIGAGAAQTAPVGVGMPSPDERRAGGQGRQTDADLNRATERRAVELATAHMLQHGWTEVIPLGKPYDLVCRRDDGQEKHVEVKGSSGATGSVIYTRNEVAHFRRCPHGADLIVVRDIELTLDDDGAVTATGGELKHVANYRAPDADLKVLTFQGRVTW
ncbi:protein NO VEIN domain-containing protein [Nocardioides bruguierae]|uniref:protein NO VEIN domain-containing protein n=1 Tax=Nocardioides bruguierae TaxID=2945102 RepID=UPI003558934D